MRKIVYSLAIMFALLPVSALAAQFKSEDSGQVNVAKTENPRNLYVAGETVSVDGNVAKDLVAAGNNITVSGNVENSLLAAGSILEVNGTIGSSARLVGNTITLNGKVKDDFLAGGSTITIGKDAEINGDLIIAGGFINIKGHVDGKVLITGGNVTISGKVDGNVDAKEINQLTIVDGAVIGGKLSYKSTKEAKIADGAKIVGGVSFDQSSAPSKKLMSSSVTASMLIYKILGILIFLLILIYLIPKFTGKFVEKAFSNVWSNLGLGFLTLVVAPIAFIILLILTLTIGFAFASLFFYISFIILSTVLAALLIGAGAYKMFKKEKGWRIDWATGLIGAIGVAVIWCLPIVGPFAIFVFFLISLGTLLRLFGEFVQNNRK